MSDFVEKEQVKTDTSSKKARTIIAILLAFTFLFAFIGGYFIARATKNEPTLAELLAEIKKRSWILSEEMTDDDIADEIVKSLLAADKYAKYYSKEEYETMIQEGKGSYGGFGVTFSSGTNKLYGVVGNSPAYYAGLESGDRITAGKRAADDDFVNFQTADDIISMFSEVEIGETITVRASRTGVFFDKEFQITKTNYIASYVSYCDSERTVTFVTDAKGKVSEVEKTAAEGGGMSELPADVGYVRLDSFEGDAATQFGAAMEKFGAEVDGKKPKLILDLRNNGGGYMDIMLEIASYLVKKDETGSNVVTYCKEKGRTTHYELSKDNYNEALEKITVIANQNTASASECLIGAMHQFRMYYDYRSNFSLANLVLVKNNNGVARTYGKGIMQTTVPLNNGGAIKLTTAQLYWPDKETSIHEIGIMRGTEYEFNIPLENEVENGFAIARAIEVLELPLEIKPEVEEEA